MPPPVPPSVKAGPHDGRQPDALERRRRRPLAAFDGRSLDDLRRRVGLADAIEQVAEALPVLGHLDGLERRAQQPHAGPLEDAGACQRDGEVERRLAAQAGQDAVGPLALDDALHRFDRQRLEVDDVRDARVGHDRGRVGVEQDRPDALLAQRPAGLRAGIVELGRLADDDRAGADDEHRARGRVADRSSLGRDGAHRRRALQPRHEAVEDLERVERPGRALGVVLDGLDGPLTVAQALDRAVVEVALADVEAARRGQRLADDLDLVVLGRDLDPAALEVLDRVVGAVVPEAQAAVSAPAARPTIWWPRQMPSSGRPSSMMARDRATGPSSRAGSPGPGERTTPAISGASTSAAVAVCGSTRTRAPRRRRPRTMLVLRPKSTTATSGPSPVPMSYGAGAETCSTKSWSSQASNARAAATAASTSVSPGAEM